jgi:hypothetical protein
LAGEKPAKIASYWYPPAAQQEADMSGLKTMLRNNTEQPKAKKNVRFVNPESVSSGYASSEIDHMPLSPQQMMNAPSPAAPSPAVFQYPVPLNRQLNFQPALASYSASCPVIQSSMPVPLSPPPTPLYTLPTIAESPVHTPPPPCGMFLPHQHQFTTPHADPEMAHRWSKWTQLVQANWPYLAQMDENSRFQKICELAVIAASV